ncbi:MAG: CAP domain-containing protein [Halioglobus sp.]
MIFSNMGFLEFFSSRKVLLGLVILLLPSCRLIITTDNTGSIVSTSGSASCDQASCVIPIDAPLRETFTAVAAEGYRFVRWEGVCDRAKKEVCKLNLSPLPQQLIQFDGDVSLSAVFESSAFRRAWYRDEDRDGFGAPNNSVMAFERPKGFVINSEDCDDNVRRIHPAAREREDGRDNNCDGQIDEGFNVDEMTRTFYRDVDGDGFGRSSGAIESTEPIDGYVENAQDCDDNNNRIFPGAREEFDSLDNNCDGVIDEGFTQRTYYRDVDGDGFGDASNSVQDISQPLGYVTNSTDNCVDISNPSQTDIDRDGIGDACDTVNNDDNGGGFGSCSLTIEEQAMLDRVNATRSQARVCGDRGSFPAVSPLSWSCELETAATNHSMDMANRNFFSHTGSNGQSVGERATQAGYTWSSIGENIAAGLSFSSVDAVVQGWIDSPGHCANLMRSNYTDLGAAKFSNPSSTYNVYWTQVFGRPR